MPNFGSDVDLEPGDVVAEKYVIRKLVGQGAFGRVFAADDLHLRRRVALKTLYGSQSGEHIRRFRREIALIKSIEHGNVVRLYDFGTDARGMLFMSMEFVDGFDLGKTLKADGAFEPLRALGITFQILDALIEAQKLGVVHRDLKPQNIILTEKGARADVVKLLDFGLAKAYDDSGISHSGLASSLAVGTPLYMAPEQIRNGPVGPYTDVYAVGLLLLEMLTGVPPFHAESVIDLLTAKANGSVELADLRVPVEVLPIIEKAARTEYQERFQTAKEMFAALETAVQTFAPEVFGTVRTVGRPISHPVNPVDAFFEEVTPTALERPSGNSTTLSPMRRTQELDPMVVSDVEELFSEEHSAVPDKLLDEPEPKAPPASMMRRPTRSGRKLERHSHHVTASRGGTAIDLDDD